MCDFQICRVNRGHARLAQLHSHPEVLTRSRTVAVFTSFWVQLNKESIFTFHGILNLS